MFTVHELIGSCETYFGFLRSDFPAKHGCPGHADAKKYDEEDGAKTRYSRSSLLRRGRTEPNERNWNERIVLNAGKLDDSDDFRGVMRKEPVGQFRREDCLGCAGRNRVVY